MTKPILMWILTFCLNRVVLFQGPVPEHPISYYHGLEVHISPENPAFPQNEPLHLRVEFRNEGSSTIRVGRAVGTDAWQPFRLAIRIEDSHGHLILEPVRDLVELPCVDLRESDVRNPKIWVELAPHANYTQVLEVITKALGKAPPGRYKIMGRYRSYGVLEGGHCMYLQDLRDSKKSSTGQEWEGEVDTNAVWITVLAPGEEPSPF